MNYLLPLEGVMTMHCSANIGSQGDTALFFGLSGTGKTTLSADPRRGLIGDDEHGWSDSGVFNFEGGSYAKAIRLSPEGEPEIYAATQMFGTVLENCVLDPHTRLIDFDSDRITENTRASYPIDFIPNHEPSGFAGHPKNIVFLTADAFGVLPPVARLTPEQAMYHFLSGYTAKVAGTERGTLKDNGCGIPENFKPNLFKPFFTTKEHGTGLGLVIMRNMVAKMDGTIDIASREEVGTTVTLDLPAGRAPARRIDAPAPPLHGAVTRSHATSGPT